MISSRRTALTASLLPCPRPALPLAPGRLGWRCPARSRPPGRRGPGRSWGGAASCRRAARTGARPAGSRVTQTSASAAFIPSKARRADPLRGARSPPPSWRRCRRGRSTRAPTPARVTPGTRRTRSRPLKPIALGAQVAGGVVGHLAAGRRRPEAAVEARLVPDRPEVLRDVHHRGGQLLGAGAVRPLEQVRPLPAHHHRAGRIHHQHLGPALHVRQRAGRGPGGAQARTVSRSPCSQAGIPQQASPFTTRTSTPLRRRTKSVSLPSCGLVVLHEAGLEEHRLAARLRASRSRSRPPSRRRPGAAKSGRSLSRCTPAVFSSRTRNGRVRFMTLAMPRERRAILPARVGVAEHALPQRASCARPCGCTPR